MSNIDKLNDHELVDLKKDIERELKRRADGPKVTTYYVVSCITDAQHFTDMDCALRCLKRVTEDLMEWVSSNAIAGEECGNLDSQGYLRFRVLGQEFRAHRLAVFYMTGKWPLVTDHINGNRADNRWSNIRVTDSKGNARNLSTRHDNKSGHKGVTWDSRREKWLVQLGRDGEKITIGRYRDRGLAVAMAKAAYEYLAPDVTHRSAMLNGGKS
ncbi:hypothetical protein IFF33_003934 [Salmonella enterica]|nr:hypothetical protein [Salmonella enterica]